MRRTSIERLARPAVPVIPTVLFYLGVLGVAWLIAWGCGRSTPFVLHTPVAPMGVSLGVGVGSGIVLASMSWWGERTVPALGRLRDALAARVGRVSPGAAAVMAVSSGVAEEALFRGALLPVLGVAGSSVLFGILHIGRDRTMWVWIAVAFVAGLAFAALSLSTGDILAAATAHAVVNYVGFLSLSGR